MADKKPSRLDRLEAAIERLIAAQSTQAPSREDVSASVPVADARPATGTRVQLPASAALNALQGQCRPVAARIVEKHVKAGVADMQAYVAKLAEFQTGAYQSPRFQYANAMLAAMQSGKPTTPTTRVGLRRPRNTDAITPKRGNGGSAVATVKQPKPDASNADWMAYVRAVDNGQSSVGAAAWRSRAWRAKEIANDRDPYRAAK